VNGTGAAVRFDMAKRNAKSNPVNQELGKHKLGSEPGQEQLHPRLDRQNTGNGGGSALKAKNQGRQRGGGQGRSRTR
jgi:hypothetical protein